MPGFLMNLQYTLFLIRTKHVESDKRHIVLDLDGHGNGT